MNLKKDGTYYIGYYDGSLMEDKIYFDFQSCAGDASYTFIDVYDSKGEYMGYLELIGGDYE